MTREALYIEDHCKIPVWDESTQLWHVRYYTKFNWFNASFSHLKEATEFYHSAYEEIRKEYRLLHETRRQPLEKRLAISYNGEKGERE